MKISRASSRAASILLAAAMPWAAPGLPAHAAAASIVRAAPEVPATAAGLGIPGSAPAASLGALPLAASAIPLPSAVIAAPALDVPSAAASAELQAAADIPPAVSAADSDEVRTQRGKVLFDGEIHSPGASADAPSPNDGAGTEAKKAPASKREPFVAATRKVAELEKLAKTDPEKALRVAIGYLSNGKERRREVRLAALRVLETRPLKDVLPFYRRYLQAGTNQAVQIAKSHGVDDAWYIQREILLRLTREGAAVKADEMTLELIRTSYRDGNASVRLAAAAALSAAGVEPGPEVEAEPPSPLKPAAPRSGILRSLSIAIAGAALVSALVFTVITAVSPQAPPAAPPAAVQTQKADAPAAKAAADAPKAKEPVSRDERIASSLDRMAQALEDQTAAQKAEAEAAKNAPSLLSGIIGMVINAAIFVGLFMLIGRLLNRGGGASNGSLSAPTSAKADVEKPAQRFSDVEGSDESLVAVQEIADFLRAPDSFKRLGARAPKGILFEGPPGTGKTLMARALAGETDAAFFAVSGSDFIELFVGVGARRVRELVAKASGHKPAIIFIDEIDAVGKARGGAGGFSGSTSEHEQTINALLAEMDGFDNSGGIVFVAATNRADTLDPALMRPGRFDRKIYVGKPHMGGREAILTIHAGGKRLAPAVDLRHVARRTAGLAGADLENIMNEAALLARRRGADSIEMQDIDEAVDAGTIGAKRSLPMPEALKKRVAYHEAGHVLANMLHENRELRKKVNKFTIVPHGSGALGFAETGDEDGDRYLYTREELEARIDHALGGLVAEKLIFGKPENIPAQWSPDWSTGPGSDLEQATNVARLMVQTLGMGEDTGLAVTAPDHRDPMGRAPFGDAVGEKTWREVNKILAAAMSRVTARLTRNRHVLEALTAAVLERETLLGDEIEDVVRKAGPAE